MPKFFKDNWVLPAIIILWVIFGYLGVGQIYHQDEHRWSMLADGSEKGDAPHPPVTLTVLKITGAVLGFNNLRAGIFLFGILNLILVYLVSKKISGKKSVALIASSLFAINVYSLIASLQIDIDGAILPFFVLAGYYAYKSLKEGKNLVFWAIVFFVVLAGGFLSKLSYVLFIGVMMLDFIFELYTENKLKISIILKYIPMVILPLVITGGFFYYFNAQHFSTIAKYGEHFKVLNFRERAYFELAFKVMKSIVWLSPFVLLPMLFGLFKKELLLKYRFWYLYLFVNTIFYLVLFDFTKLTVERYFMFMIVPAVLISAEVLYNLYKKIPHTKPQSEWLAGIGIFLIFASLVLSMGHDVVPLNPKSAFVDHIRSLDLNFLIPFSGGSGPIGFYFSAKFILVSWILSLAFLLGSIWKTKYSFLFLVLFAVFGAGYNTLLITEYLGGSFYGNVPKVARETVNYVLSDDNIKEVITYGDIGAHELKASGKYSARFYTAPSRDYTDRLNAFRGHYMVVDFPAIGRNDRYWKLLERCEEIKRFTDKKINSYIFDCSKI